eukprot:6164870-Amphidinium_carterae.1
MLCRSTNRRVKLITRVYRKTIKRAIAIETSHGKTVHSASGINVRTAAKKIAIKTHRRKDDEIKDHA